MRYILVLFFAAIAITVVCGQGIPIRKCPAGEHSVLYCPQRAEPSCDNPAVHGKLNGPCDVPQCFCNTPNVRDTKTMRCIPLSQC